jgi:hypothetical protein
MKLKLMIAAVAAAILGGCVIVPEHGHHGGWHDRGWRDHGWHRHYDHRW